MTEQQPDRLTIGRHHEKGSKTVLSHSIDTQTADTQNTIPQALLGKEVANRVLANTKAKLEAWAEQDFVPQMVSVMASDDEASRIYVESKARKGEQLGARFAVQHLPEGGTQAQLNELLERLSADDDVHGIVLQMPVAEHLNADEAILHIAPHKDIEGFTPKNISLVAAAREDEAILPPTPQSVRYLLREALGEDLRGKHIAIVGPGRTVGRPLIFLLNNAGATITVCNEFTTDLPEKLAEVDAIAVAVGCPDLLRPEHVRPHHVIVDAGINVVDGKLTGDARPNLPVRIQTPVPRGVGPLTSALMYHNLVCAVELQRKELQRKQAAK